MIGVDARGVPIAVRLTVGDIDADGDAVPHLLFGSVSVTIPVGHNPGCGSPVVTWRRQMEHQSWSRKAGIDDNRL